jgi:adenosylcobinamide-GDP ribazoletransferase
MTAATGQTGKGDCVAKTDTALTEAQDITEALGLLTRFPVRTGLTRGPRAAWAWPLAGVAVAFVAALVAEIGLWLGLSYGLAAGLALAAQIAATGAMHEDGLADCADGFWGGGDRSRRLEIMKDSRSGSYGVLALGLGLILRWSALSVLFAHGWVLAPLIAAAVLSRAPMAVLMAAMPNARGTGLASAIGKPSQATATLGIGVALLIALLAVGWGVLAPAFWVALTAIGIAALAKERIGGQTGDVLGATQQVTEIAALAALTTLI